MLPTLILSPVLSVWQHPHSSGRSLMHSMDVFPSRAPGHASTTHSRVRTGPVVVLLRGQEEQKKKNRDILALSPFPAEGQARKQIKWITLNPD